MGFVTREFAQIETLERAKRWLTEVGFHPSRIELHTHGTPRITVTVEPGQAAEVEQILDAVASSDPAGSPSFWDHPQHHHDAKHAKPASPDPGALKSEKLSILAGAERSRSRRDSGFDRHREAKGLSRGPRLIRARPGTT